MKKSAKDKHKAPVIIDPATNRVAKITEDRMIQSLFRDRKSTLEAFNECLTLLYDKYKMNSAEASVVACTLGHFTWHDIEREFRVDRYIDAIEHEVKARGWNFFKSSVIKGTESVKPKAKRIKETLN